jgi:hypothetical protein
MKIGRPTFTFDQIEEMAAELLGQGHSPRSARLALASKGIRWEYQFLGQGRAERLRRLKRTGHTLCRCGQPMPNTQTLCYACLAKKWSL